MNHFAYFLDKSGKILDIDPAVETLGYTVTELLGMPIVNLAHPSDLPAVILVLKERRIGHTSKFPVRLLTRRPCDPCDQIDGRSFYYSYFLLSSQGVYTGDSTCPDQFIGTEGLVHRFSPTLDFDTVSDRIEIDGTMYFSEDALRGVFHDIGNLLTGVKGYAEIASRELPQVHSARRYHLEVVKLAEKIKSVLAQARVQINGGSAQNGTKINDIVNEVATLVKDTTSDPKKPFITKVRFDVPDPIVPGSPVMIFRIILNLCLNAVQAVKSEGGDVAIRVDRAAPVQYLGNMNLSEAMYVRISVRDNGCGIPEYLLEKIFMPSFSTRSSSGGSGIGLYASRQMARMMGGDILVQSIPGKGSDFVLWLPTARITHPDNAQ